MKATRVLGNTGVAVRWTARVLSLVTAAVFTLILFLAVTGEDKPEGPAIPALVLLGLTVLACLTAWRWERAGGIVIVVGAVCLTIAVYVSASILEIGSARFLGALIYGVPFLIVGVLFWVAGRSSKG